MYTKGISEGGRLTRRKMIMTFSLVVLLYLLCVMPVKAQVDLPSQSIRLVDDFNGDGFADIMWQDDSMQVHLSLMRGSEVIGCRQLGSFTDALIGSGDFNGDDKADVVVRNLSNGAVRIGLSAFGVENEERISQWIGVGDSPIAMNVKLEGIGKFFSGSNLRSNMLWRNQDTGRTLMTYHWDSGRVRSWFVVSEFIDPREVVALQVDDINGDGKDDVVWRNTRTGNVVISLMNGVVATWRQVTASPLSLNIQLEAAGDFDGNGRADLLWRNRTTGRSVLSYHQTDGSVESWPLVSNFINPITTQAQAVADFNGDGKDDIIWRNLVTGNTVLSLMQGSTPEWRATSFTNCSKLPHTGISVNQCYRANNNTLASCSPSAFELILGSSSINLNAQQDGHRRHINSISRIRNTIGGCETDLNTGLTWQTPSTFVASKVTNLGINNISDTGGLIVTSNASNRCGFNDWRLPTVNELLTIYNYGQTTNPRSTLAIGAGHVDHAYHWSAQNGSWFNPSLEITHVVAFNRFNTSTTPNGMAGRVDFMDRSSSAYAILVRGQPRTSSVRYSFMTVPYSTDVSNNVVFDSWTGMQWRRCPQGTTWNGTICSGRPEAHTHESALTAARLQAGWRMPNVMELVSLYDHSRPSIGNGYIDESVFPFNSLLIGGSDEFWTSTPFVDDPSKAWAVNDFYGTGLPIDRSNSTLYLRLVRSFH